MTSEHHGTRENIPANIAAQIEMKKRGRRKNVYHGGTLCGRCYSAPPLPSHRYCRLCKQAADRERLARKKAALESVAIQAKAGG